MKKFTIPLILALSVTACASLRTVGTVPQGKEKNPDLTAKYDELKSFDIKKMFKAKSNLDYQDFVIQKCKDMGKKGYQAYIVGPTSEAEIGPITLSEKTTLKIWCK